MRATTCCALALTLLAFARTASAQEIAAVVAGPSDEAARRHLGLIAVEPVGRRESAFARDPASLLDEARRAWPERYIVVLDSERATITVLRPADGTVLVRVLDPAAARASPYAVALAAAELLDVVRDAPEARTARLEPPPASHAARPALPLRVRLAPRLGVLWVEGLDRDAALIEPTLGLDVVLGAAHAPWWFGAGLHAGAFGSIARDVAATAASPSGAGRVFYGRYDATARLSVGRTYRGTGFAAWVQSSGVVTTAEVHDAGGVRLGARPARLGVRLGLGAEVRLGLPGALAVAAGAGLEYDPAPEDLLVRGAAVLSEPSLAAVAHFAVLWQPY